MNWLSVLVSTAYYFSRPFVTLFHGLLVALSPVIHLFQYGLSGVLFPFTLFAKFETLYIYLGVAAVIGLVAGSVLHLSSSLLGSLLDLSSRAELAERTAASLRAAREQKMLDNAWQSSMSTSKTHAGMWSINASTEKLHSELLTKETPKRREGGLRGPTILEEDDSDEGF